MTIHKTKHLIISIFVSLLLVPAAHAEESQSYSEVYVPELADDGSVVFTKKSTSELEQPPAPVLKLRSSSVKCCADVPIRTPGGTTVIKVCRQFPGTQCPSGTQKQ